MVKGTSSGLEALFDRSNRLEDLARSILRNYFLMKRRNEINCKGCQGSVSRNQARPGSNFKSSWEIFKSVKALHSSLENCYVNPRFWYIEKYKTKSNKAKLFGPAKIHISQLQISIFPIPILFTTSRKNS